VESGEWRVESGEWRVESVWAWMGSCAVPYYLSAIFNAHTHTRVYTHTHLCVCVSEGVGPLVPLCYLQHTHAHICVYIRTFV